MLTASLSRQGGGMSEAVRQLALAMNDAYACDIRVFGVRDAYTEDDLPAWGGLSTSACPVRGPEAFGYAPALTAELQRACLDLLHIHGLWTYLSVASTSWGRRDRRPYLVSPHGMLDPWALNHAWWKKRLAGRLYESAHLQAAHCLHAVCEAEVAAIRSYGLNNPVCVIPNGVTLPVDFQQVRRPWQAGFPDDGRVLLYLGRLHPKKGLAQLIKGWYQMRQLGRSAADGWSLVIAGWDQNGHEAELARLAATLGVSDQVRFVGPQFEEDRAATLRRAAAFVLPSVSEGLPMAVLEAWAHELPVIMTSQCNLTEGFSAGAAICVESDAQSISAGLSAMMSLSDQERGVMGLRGRELVREHYSWRRVAEEMLAVYKWLLGGGPKPSCVEER